MIARLGLLGLLLFGAASVAFYRVNDRIVWDICRRENRPYRQDWTLSLYWQWRNLAGWYADARRAGLFLARALATAAIILTFLGSVVAGILATQAG
ncbi:hypothetical protein [Microvirga puerhi]|uniref:Uncharacterized protein n=1 Tax=Microvirga puerhi TaxID=2876078 RepID=A0ABS7VRI5_9HYPH|nr:hypothetical protein [Microvirga puerhi]MBZ6078163.1 hypothetical protein [Microvirga puerhi]